MSKRMLLTLEYDGTAYAGWQRQLNGPSVQQELEKALHKLTGTAITVTGASRTDAGVHALGQRAHFDTISRIPDDKWPFALNTLLPKDIRVVASQPVGLHCVRVPGGVAPGLPAHRGLFGAGQLPGQAAL